MSTLSEITFRHDLHTHDSLLLEAMPLPIPLNGPQLHSGIRSLLIHLLFQCIFLSHLQLHSVVLAMATEYRELQPHHSDLSISHTREQIRQKLRQLKEIEETRARDEQVSLPTSANAVAVHGGLMRHGVFSTVHRRAPCKTLNSEHCFRMMIPRRTPLLRPS